MANDLWRWADPNGQQRKVRLDELRASLASGIIAPNAPVWRAGWSGWRHAHEVPELTSASVGGANGVVLNIPPPPLAMVAVQQQYEAAGDSLMPSPSSAPPDAQEEPPPPPAYVPVPAKAPSIAPPSTSLKTQMAGSTTTTGGVLPAPSAPKLGPSLATQIGVPPPPTEPSLGPPSVEELSTSALIDSPSSPETANRVSTNGLGMPPPTVPIILTPGEAMDASLIGLPRRSPLAPLLDDVAAMRRGEKPKNRNLLIVVGVVGLMLVVLVVAGIASLFGGPEKPAKTAASASASGKPKAIASVTSAATASATAVATVPPPPPPAETAAPADTASFGECSSAGDDRPIAPRAVVTAGIEAQALNGGLALGFAATPRDGVALQLDPGALSVTTTVHARPAADLRRVTPMLVGGKLTPMPDVDRRGDKIASRRAAATSTPADVGVVDGNVVWAPHGKDSSAVLFPLEGDTPIEAMRVVGTPTGLVLAFRRGNAIHVGAAKGEGTLEADGELSRIVGLGQTGSPALAVSGDQVVVAWADRPGQGTDWVVRWARAKVGATIQSSEAQVLGASGGLGAPFMSPSVASLGGGHFLIAWSEGPVSGHQVRAMTIGKDGAAGEPITISGPSSNAGQPAAVVGPDGRGLVAFLATKGKSFELHATPIHCK